MRPDITNFTGLSIDVFQARLALEPWYLPVLFVLSVFNERIPPINTAFVPHDQCNLPEDRQIVGPGVKIAERSSVAVFGK